MYCIEVETESGANGSHYHSLGFEYFYKCEDRTSLQVFLGQRVCELESVFTLSLTLLLKLLNMALEQRIYCFRGICRLN